jgi:hypothetical protein
MAWIDGGPLRNHGLSDQWPSLPFGRSSDFPSATRQFRHRQIVSLPLGYALAELPAEAWLL